MPNPHDTKIRVTNTALFGVLIALAYLRTRSLWLPWGLHFGCNAMLGLICGLPVSGVTECAVVGKGEAIGPVWLTGGAYGLEGSATATGVLIAATVFLWLITRWRRLRTPPASPIIESAPTMVLGTESTGRPFAP